MENNFSFTRVLNLLKYNRASYQKILLTIFAVAEAVLLGIMTFRYLTAQDPHSYSFMEGSRTLVMFIFVFTLLGVTVRLTQLLHRKINHGSNSIPFVMLPASTFEKYVEIHLSYLGGFALSAILWFINYSIFVDLPYGGNLSGNSYFQESLMSELPEIATLIKFGIAIFVIYSLFMYILYLNLNLFFKKNPQPKSILIIWLGFSCYMIYLFYLVTHGWLPNSNGSFGITTETLKSGITYGELRTIIVAAILPVIALFFGFYYRMKEKQIR